MKQFLVFLLVCLASVAASAQQLREGDVLDKIVAVVGKEIVLRSEIDGQLYMLAQQNKEINPSDTKLRTRVLDALINDRLMYNKAIEDSIQVSDDEVNQQLDATIAQLTAQ
ncbi:MAG: SurA N-terminal domain-containing protein, partial [Candidatus Kapabacteria bacterium]|nr:SurA N-terminal domain-containing protein [Candidatus Kapabacteria bacterium]